MTFRTYCGIENLYRDTEILEQETVIATEKVHGTSVRIAFINDSLVVGGRNQVFATFHTEEEWNNHSEKPKGDGYGFSLWLRDKYPELFVRASKWNNFAIYGEFFGKGIQKGIDYGPDKYFRVFDVYDLEKEEWASYDKFEDVAWSLRLTPVPLFHFGKPNLEQFKKLYCIDSVVAKENGVTTTPNILEGVVIKPEPNVRDKHGNRLIVKFKNDKFAEIAKAKKSGKEIKEEDILQQAEIREFVNTFVTPARIDHALQRLFEEGGMEVGMKQTPEVIQSVWLDLQKECSEDLVKLPEKETRKTAGHRTVLLLKQHLGLVL